MMVSKVDNRVLRPECSSEEALGGHRNKIFITESEIYQEQVWFQIYWHCSSYSEKRLIGQKNQNNKRFGIQFLMKGYSKYFI